MYLNMHLLRSLMNRRGLLGMGLGVYWAIVLVVGFRAHAGIELGDREMMKKTGGQTQGGACAILANSLCNQNSDCVTCSASQLNQPCTTTEQVAQYPETCFSNPSATQCIPGGGVSVACQKFYQCICEKAGMPQQCNTNNMYLRTFCFTENPGSPIQPCSYQPCPN